MYRIAPSTSGSPLLGAVFSRSSFRTRSPRPDQRISGQ
jgi:hypothetical protein